MQWRDHVDLNPRAAARVPKELDTAIQKWQNGPEGAPIELADNDPELIERLRQIDAEGDDAGDTAGAQVI